MADLTSGSGALLPIDGAAERFPAIMRILREIRSMWPEHLTFIQRRFAKDDVEFLASSEALAEDILRLTNGRLDEFCADYKWMCDEFVKEELHFRRNKTYRLSTLAEAQQAVYDNPDFMKRYMCGLLISQILWRNHASVIDCYVRDFLGKRETSFRHLEVGPGHGLFLHRAANHPLCTAAHGWDISETSLDATTAALAALGSSAQVSLERRDVAATEAAGADFDTVVISEVLEHVEQPGAVLEGLQRVMRPGGHIFINVPINSPAPDHIYLWRTPEEFVDLVVRTGFEIVQTNMFPATGVTLEQARKMALTISTVIIAKRVS